MDLSISVSVGEGWCVLVNKGICVERGTYASSQTDDITSGGCVCF